MPHWQAFFQSLKDDPASVTKSAKGPSWKKPGWPPSATANSSRRSTATGPTAEKAIGDKIKGKAQKSGVELTSADVRRRRAIRSAR